LVQKALGHSDLSTTIIYTHIVDEDMEAARQRFHLGEGKATGDFSMSVERVDLKTPRMQAAIAELQARIQQAYLTAIFAVIPGDDPDGVYVLATVDVEDTDAVVDVYIDRLLSLQIDDGLPIYVVPLRLHPQRETPSPAGE
jgi:hypothetical protein